MAYAGDLDRAREPNERARAGAVSPSMVSFGAYVAGEIEGRAGAIGAAEEHYVRAVELARGSGATFLVGVATVGLLSARARAGHVADTLRGYREVIDYFAGTGNWTHLWATLRNLAELLDRLGDDRSAAVLRAAADRAPDAPAVGPGTIAVSPPVDLPVPGRDDVLDIARRAIELGLRGSAPGDAGTSRADTPA